MNYAKEDGGHSKRISFFLDMAAGIEAEDGGQINPVTVVPLSEPQGAFMIETGERTVVGVNKYASDTRQKIEIFKMDQGSEDEQIRRLRALKKNRDETRVREMIDRLEEVCDKGVNVIPTVIEAVRNKVTLGEIMDVYRSVFGTFQQPNLF